MKRALAWLLVTGLSHAAAACAAYYVDERFDGAAFPPPGWEHANSGHGGWYRTTGGSTGYYAIVYMGSNVYNQTIWADLETYPFAVAANATLYYRFNYSWYDSAYADGEARFYVYFTDNGSRVLDVPLTLSPTWVWASGSGTVSRSQPVRARWHVGARITYPSGGGATMRVDTCQLSDANMTAASPASLGRVKVLFR